MFKKILLGALCSVALSACGSEGDSSNPATQKPLTQAETLQKLEDEGKIPKLERTDSIAGIDNDQNGIRDDIDTYILKNYPNEEQRKAVNQYAKSIQAYLTTDVTDELAVQEASNQNTRAMSCIFEKFNKSDNGPNGSIVDEIGSITTNTKKRLVAFYKFNSALDGSVVTLPKRDFCDE